MPIILQKETNFLKKTLPYWKNWKKNGAFATLAGEGGEADNSAEERAGGARETDKTRREEDGVVDNFTEGDEFPEERAGGARETEESGVESPVDGRVRAVRDIAAEGIEAVREAVEEVVAGGSSIRLLIRV